MGSKFRTRRRSERAAKARAGAAGAPLESPWCDERPASEPIALPAPADAPGWPAAGGSGPAAVPAWDRGRMDPAIVAIHERYSCVAEQFRAVRARLLSMNAANAHRVIAISSSCPREGKSVCCANLGLLMAEGGEHVTLIADGDLRRPALGRLLGLPPRPGLAELIRGEARLEDVLCPTPHHNLKVLQAGALAGASAAELLALPGLRETLAGLRSLFDYTFLDLPPVNGVSDVSVVAPQCDGLLLVLRMHATPEPDAEQAVRTLRANKVKVLGCLPTYCQDEAARDHGYCGR